MCVCVSSATSTSGGNAESSQATTSLDDGTTPVHISSSSPSSPLTASPSVLVDTDSTSSISSITSFVPGGTVTSSPPVAAATVGASSESHAGAIAGGVIGALLSLALLAAALLFFLRRRARKQRPAPSAEFLSIARGGGSASPVFAAKGDRWEMGTPTNTHFVTLGQGPPGSVEDDELPPAFTPGHYRDPVLEKVQESAEMRQWY
ncbi:hypothetical protein C8Q80DRAFT_442865 [Daedaleopsis nitida]|nr:hypothetical protein C8Q80DRAFT_442865 [Daedaleopsis nitida]